MPKYIYTAINENGEKVRGLIEADSMGEFNLILKGKKEYLIKVKNKEENNLFKKKIIYLKIGIEYLKKSFLFYADNFLLCYHQGLTL